LQRQHCVILHSGCRLHALGLEQGLALRIAEYLYQGLRRLALLALHGNRRQSTPPSDLCGNDGSGGFLALLFFGVLSFFFTKQLLKPCVLGLAAAQHELFCESLPAPMFPPVNSPATAGIHDRKKLPMFTSIVRFLRSWKRYNQSINELNRLGDRELADIGISRSDIVRVAWQSSQNA
jgi:uncharacterized protein YjiS (DUF1127 family)